MIRMLAIAAFLAATPAVALDLGLSGTSVAKTDRTEAGSVRLPDGPWHEDVTAPQIEGAITRTVLRSRSGSRTTLQLLAPLRDQLSAAGFQTVFACADRACGGFDFRFQLDLIDAPDMYVDLGDYRYLLMRRATGEPHTVSIVTSRSAGAGFIHITEVSEAIIERSPAPSIVGTTEQTGVSGDLVAALTANGHVVLSDLAFDSGSSSLSPGAYESLAQLGDWMTRTPGVRIALVGHTDSIGGREGNLSLSRQRAEAVRARLIDDAGVDPGRIEADGVGYLSPLAPNTTEDGRSLNRRVEAVLLSLE